MGGGLAIIYLAVATVGYIVFGLLFSLISNLIQLLIDIQPNTQRTAWLAAR